MNPEPARPIRDAGDNGCAVRVLRTGIVAQIGRRIGHKPAYDSHVEGEGRNYGVGEGVRGLLSPCGVPAGPGPYARRLECVTGRDWHSWTSPSHTQVLHVAHRLPDLPAELTNPPPPDRCIGHPLCGLRARVTIRTPGKFQVTGRPVRCLGHPLGQCLPSVRADRREAPESVDFRCGGPVRPRPTSSHSRAAVRERQPAGLSWLPMHRRRHASRERAAGRRKAGRRSHPWCSGPV